MAGTMEPIAPSTPSSGRSTTRVRTPPAPQHGYSDSYEPYSPRKSTRIAQRTAHRTPSPQPSSRHHSSDQPDSSLGSPKSSKKRFTSSMATPALSPQKKRMPPLDPSRRASGALTVEGTAHAAVVLGLSPAPTSKTESRSARASGAMAGAGMLITPAKTPQRPPDEKVKANVKSVARNLFHSDEETATVTSPRKMRTQAQTPNSFYTGVNAESSFQIYTDSHERIPEIDSSAENPFYVGPHAAAPEPVRRRSKRQTVSIPGEGTVTVDEAVRRDDGMLITFRGKKQFRKYADADELGNREGLDDGEGGLEGAVESSTRRHFTRSSIKPRLLFPMEQPDETQHETEDDEATDIEDHVLAAMEADEPGTPVDLVDDAPDTPKAPRFAPASPPTTTRTTRFGGKGSADATPVKTRRPAKPSPFDSWRRVKSGAQSTSHKRSGDELPAAVSKRTRA